ncbi:MAG: Ig-like domain-containing protein [Cytophagaceae bacterium]
MYNKFMIRLKFPDLKKTGLLMFLIMTISSHFAFSQKSTKADKITLGKVTDVLNSFDTGSNAGARKDKSKTVKYKFSDGKDIELLYRRTEGKPGDQTLVGSVSGDSTSFFYIIEKAGKLEGAIVFLKEKKAFQYKTANDGTVSLVETEIDKVMCVEGAQNIVANQIPGYFFVPVTNLPESFRYQSLAGAAHTIFLDFDGHSMATTLWSSSPVTFRPSNFTDEQIRQVFERVSEDFSPFKVNVTTDSTVFLNTAPGKRIRTLFTQSMMTNPTAGGVAFTGSFTWTTNEHPAFVYVNAIGNDADNAGEVASHEIGHALGLDHHTKYGTYYWGHDNWAPIMGASYGKQYSQWSHGEYEEADSHYQDDIAIIAGPENGFGLKADDYGDTKSTAHSVSFTNGRFERKGIISHKTDLDVFMVTVPGTTPVTFNFAVDVKQEESNLKFTVDILRANNTIAGSYTSVNATGISQTLTNFAPGTYYFIIDGVGQNDPRTNGFSDYGSIGAYTFSGTIISAGAGCTAPAWVSTNAYNGGVDVSYSGNTYRSKWWTQGDRPDLNLGDGKPWSLVGPCGNNQAPTVSLTKPANNFVLNESSIQLTATAADPDGSVAYVEFYNGSTLLGRVNSAPYVFFWSDVPKGTLSVRARAYDNGGANTYSSVLTIISNAAPVVSITSPTELSKVMQGSNVNITVNASDAGGQVTKVEYFWDNGIKFAESTTPPFTVSARVPAITNTVEYLLALTAIATDNQGGKGRHSIDLKVKPTVANVAPVAIVESPADGMAVLVNTEFTIVANGYDRDGFITKVEVFFNNNKLGESNRVPYQLMAPAPVAGYHNIRVVVTDEEGAVGSATSRIFAGTPPSISIISPAPNTQFPDGSRITVQTNPTDSDGTIAKVEFYMLGEKVGEVTNAPWTFTTQPVYMAQTDNGNFSIVAVAHDNSGMAAGTGVPLRLTTSTNKAPIVSITSPANNSILQAGYPVTITANASDPDGTIAKVEFFDGNNKIGEDAVAPYQLSFTPAAGSRTLTAVATDDKGLTATSAGIFVKVNAAPVASFISPVANALYAQGGTMTIQVNATDADGSVAKVEFFLGGFSNKVGERTTAPYTVTINNVPLPTSGQNILPVIVKLTDNDNGISSYDTYVRSVPNSAPTVSITAPSNGASVSPNFVVRANASDAEVNTPIKKVEFYNGNTLVFTDTQSPYEYSVTNAAVASYTYRAIAYDALDGASTTASVTFTVTGSSCSDPVWNAVTAYTGGMIVSHNGSRYRANWWNQGVNPATNSGPYQEWTLLGSCAARMGDIAYEGDEFSLFPNPAKEDVNITFTLPEDGKVFISVINSMGNVIQQYEKNLEAGYQQLNLNLQGLSSGVYILHIHRENLNKQLKFFKE